MIKYVVDDAFYGRTEHDLFEEAMVRFTRCVKAWERDGWDDDATQTVLYRLVPMRRIEICNEPVMEDGQIVGGPIYGVVVECEGEAT